MAGDKSDAHFVDSSPATGEGGTWTWEQGQDIGDYKLTYISANARIYGFPITDTKVTGLDAGVAVVNNGDGSVSLPFTNHPFEDGWIVYVTGTAGTVYNGVKTVLSGSEGTNFIKIASGSYSALTCTGAERVLRYFNMPASPYAGCAQDSDGNVYYGSTETNDTYITKIAPDGTFSYPITRGNWPYASACTCTDIQVQGDYLYYKIDTPDGLGKWNLKTNTEEWIKNAGSYAFGLDSDGNAYICRNGTSYTSGLGTTYRTMKYNSADGAETVIPFPRMRTAYETHVDSDLGIIIGAGQDNYDSANPTGMPGWNVQVANLDGSNWRGRRFGELTLNIGTIFLTTSIGKGQVWTYNGYIFVLYTGDNTLYKLNPTDLSTAATVVVPDIEGGCYDLWGNLIIISADWTTTIDKLFTWVDPDTLEVLATEDFRPNYSPLSPMSTWQPDVGSAIAHGNIFYWPGLTAQDPAPPQFIDQGRTIAYPTGYAHLEGQTVQVLKDGNYIGDDIVSGGQITLDD